ncbi:unnamed protein product [Thelazia callipaeda]|uniref:FH2 domain-containing protein n=1 Tax=Thelazia callipaeda TaxID=103827 RepID=A0A0N5DAH8_THECL|nr:unnamed protein product [Thelazia callipaeda]
MFWQYYREQIPTVNYSTPTVEMIQKYVHKLKQNLLYCLKVDRYKLIWHFKVDQEGEMYYYLDVSVVKELPVFYAQFMDEIFATANNISAMSKNQFDNLVAESELLVNFTHTVGINKTHLITLHEPKSNKAKEEPEIGILCAGIISEIFPWEHVQSNDPIDFMCKAQVSSFVIVDFTRFTIDLEDVFNFDSRTDIVILLNNETDDMITNFRTDARCLLDIKNQSVESLKKFFEKVLIFSQPPFMDGSYSIFNVLKKELKLLKVKTSEPLELIFGCSVEDCLEMLESAEIRLFGDRSSKIRKSPVQRTRMMIMNMEQEGLPLESLQVSENDQEIIKTFIGLPNALRNYLLDLIKRQPKTNEIQFLVEKMEDISAHSKIAPQYSNCSESEYAQFEQLFAAISLQEQNTTLKFVKFIFKDHLNVYDEISCAKLNNLDEEIKMLTNKVQATRKKQQRKISRIRRSHSEGENSRRSSVSRNTDMEAAIIDIEFHESE